LIRVSLVLRSTVATRTAVLPIRCLGNTRRRLRAVSRAGLSRALF
jgi:hypothetical protein